MELSGKDRYNPDLIPNLEAYVFTHAHEPQPTTTVKPRCEPATWDRGLRPRPPRSRTFADHFVSLRYPSIGWGLCGETTNKPKKKKNLLFPCVARLCLRSPTPSRSHRSVDKQISGGSFDLSTNLVLLRMYQFFPDRTNSTVLVKVLVKALMQLPGTDFTQCAYLVPQRFQLEEPIANLLTLAQHAECMQFKEFWEVASKCKYLWESIPGFEQSIRDFALHAINLTFSQIRKQKLGEILSLEGGELDALVKDRAAKSGWKVTGDVIQLGGNELKSKLGKSSGSNVLDFAQYGPLLGM